MIVDNTLVLSDSQVITATAGSTNVIDLGAAGTPYGSLSAVARDIGIGNYIPIVVLVTQAFNNLTSLKVTLESDDNAGFSSPKEIASRTFLLAELTLGAKLKWPNQIPEGTDEQFFRANYTVTGTAPTTGKIFAGIVASRQTNSN